MEQKLVELINKEAERRLEYIDRSRYGDGEQRKEQVRALQKILLGEAQLTDTFMTQLVHGNSHDGPDYLNNVINNHWEKTDDSLVNIWTIDNPLIQKMIHKNLSGSGSSYQHFVNRYIAESLTTRADQDLNRVIDFLYKQQYSDEDIVAIVCSYSSNPFYLVFNGRPTLWRPGQQEVKKENVISKFGEYLLPRLQPKKGFLGIGKNDGLKSVVDDVVLQHYHTDKKLPWVTFLYDHYPESLESDYEKFLWNVEYNGNKFFAYTIAYFFIDRNPQKFESPLIAALPANPKAEELFSFFLKLNQHFPGKYNDKLTEIGEKHFAYFSADVTKDHYYYDPYTSAGPLTSAYSEFLWQQDEAKAKQRIEKFIQEAAFLVPHYFNYLDERMGEQSVALILEALFKDPDKIPSNAREYYTTIFKILDKYNVAVHIDRIIDFCVRLADKKTRILASQTLSKYTDQIFSKATELLTAKTVDQRVTGALILSAMGTQQVEAILNDAVDKEVNDDTRDIMLETLAEKRFQQPYTVAQVKDMISKAEERKKLSKWSEKWIDEEKIPKLFWKDSQVPLDQKEVRFLLYRMKRSKGLNSDIEAKQLINHIDQDKSGSFAKATLTAFQDSNADSKVKYYLTLAGLLGGDEMMHSLNMLFKKSVADKRVKMAEYVIGALAMVGTNKALRIVEVIYRKFANKKPALSHAAQAALTAAATELSISMDELADRIIPNFDFEGLYKRFTVDGEEYRAFINADFKLNYFTEDNKVRKSLPSNATKELKAEFKEIEKEVNDVIKSQSGRLEKYMLEERRWSAENWRIFFFENPIMFVYALKLIWGVYDEQGNLINTFYCSEDTSLYNIHDEEVALEENQYVGIIHPVHLSVESLTAWRDKLYNLSMVTIFPIFDRNLFYVDEKEREQTFTKKLFGQNVPKGADFVNTFMVKKNWLKSSGDGGRSEFTKLFKDGAIRAYANIDGPAAFYQGGNAKATVFEIGFMRKSWSDRVRLKDIPSIFFSEVMNDIDELIKAT